MSRVIIFEGLKMNYFFSLVFLLVFLALNDFYEIALYQDVKSSIQLWLEHLNQ